MVTGDEPTVSVSMAQKVNLGNYESADCFVSLSGLRTGATEAEMDALLATGRIAYDRVREQLKKQVQELRR